MAYNKGSQVVVRASQHKAVAHGEIMMGLDSNNYVVPMKLSSTGEAINASSIFHTEWDYMSVSYPTGSTETYTYKTGGATGSVVATIDIAYTDATKNDISTVERS